MVMKARAGDIVGDSGPVQRIYRRTHLPGITGLSIPYIYELMTAGKFPRPVPLSDRAVGWLGEDIAAWQRDRIARRDGKAA
jgi:prophage regulatory protein